jgi:hypothetical protein
MLYAKNSPNGQIILFLANCFKKGQMATLKYFDLRRPFFSSSSRLRSTSIVKSGSEKKENIFFQKFRFKITILKVKTLFFFVF